MIPAAEQGRAERAAAGTRPRPRPWSWPESTRSPGPGSHGPAQTGAALRLTHDSGRLSQVPVQAGGTGCAVAAISGSLAPSQVCTCRGRASTPQQSLSESRSVTVTGVLSPLSVRLKYRWRL